MNCNYGYQLKFKQQTDERCIMKRTIRERRRNTIFVFFMGRQP